MTSTDAPPTTLVDDALRADLHELYRTLHAAPELSMAEHATSALVTRQVEALGFTARSVGGTGVVAVLQNGPGPVVAFRADTDALPVEEGTGLEYASTARGTLRDGTEVPVMHACGHDTHITSAIGVATLLSRDRSTWNGTLVLLFQPGEETSEGARAMVDDGLWEGTPRPEVVLGQHVWPGRAGEVEVSTSPAMAMADSWRVTVKGRGGHGSQPQSSTDPVLLAAHMVVRLQSVVSREVAPQDAAVVTVGSFHAGLKENIIPAEAVFTINVRTLDERVRDLVLPALRRVLEGEAQASGAPAPVVEELYTFPLLHNEPEATATVVAALGAVLGPEKVLPCAPRMGSEDFGHLPDAVGVPGVYWFFGGMADDVVDGPDPVPVNHSPHFALVLEPTLTTGVTAAHAAVMAWLGVRDAGA